MGVRVCVITTMSLLRVTQVDLVQNKLKLPLKPWEIARASQVQGLVSPGGGTEGRTNVFSSSGKFYAPTHLAKAPLSDYVEDMVLEDLEVEVVERKGGAVVGGERDPQQGDLALQDLEDRPRSPGAISRKLAANKNALTIVEFDDSLVCCN